MVILHEMECCLVESTPEVTFFHFFLICCWPPHTVSQKGFLRSASFLVRMPMRSVPDARQPGNGNIRNAVTDVDKDFPGQNMIMQRSGILDGMEVMAPNRFSRAFSFLLLKSRKGTGAHP